LVRVLQDHNLGELNPQPATTAVSIAPCAMSARPLAKVHMRRPRVVGEAPHMQTHLEATSFASSGWLLPVSSLIELDAMPCDEELVVTEGT
jgi:hypothetical protein